ncbi:hypothetical protein L3X38_011915 [Prunus dulcis]|uniref:Transposable element protein n=1 Tax=Prunus dulcis TaxID=3755 RepID=A0AAD4WJ16_PRUDU|nr:hypothetical protein L3X38_011915 [Prunus dulcis]
MARKCSAQGLKKGKQTQFLPVNQADLKGVEQAEEKANPNRDQVEGIHPEVSPEEGWKPEEEVELVPLDPDKPERKERIGSCLSHEEKIELAAFLQNNKDVFAWSPSDMPGIDPQIICHHLHVNAAIKPVAKKRRNFASERVTIIEAEIDKLLAAGFIKEVSYAEWLANVVLVAKKDKGLWRVCVDYTDLNTTCPKDNFSLPRIDQLVDSTSGNQLLSFMDAYSGYNQIMMHEDDMAKTSFIIERGAYCYKVMPFGLKNARATYQRLVNKIFKEQIGKTMEVYVDDMLVQSQLNGEDNNGVSENLRWLAAGSSMAVPSYRIYLIKDSTSGLVVDELGFTLVDLSKIGHRNDQFVMASQVKQVFFVDDPMHYGWSVVLSMPNREYNDVIGDDVLGDVRIECEPFTRGMPNVDTFDELVGESGSKNIRDGCEDIWIE